MDGERGWSHSALAAVDHKEGNGKDTVKEAIKINIEDQAHIRCSSPLPCF